MDSPAPLNFRAAQAAAAYTGRATPRAPIGHSPSNIADSGSPTRATASRTAEGTIVPPHARPIDSGAMRLGRHQDALSPSLAAMVAGQIDSPVSRGEGFEAPRTSPQITAADSVNPSATTRSTPMASASSGAFAMYSRAADRIEVATSVQVGRNLDARG